MRPGASPFAARFRTAVTGLAILAVASFGEAMPPPQSACWFDQIYVSPRDEVVMAFTFMGGRKLLYRRSGDVWQPESAGLFTAVVNGGRHGLYAIGQLAEAGPVGLFHSMDGRDWNYRGPARALRVVDGGGALYACEEGASALTRSDDGGRSWTATARAPGGCAHLLSAAGRLFAFGEPTSDLAVSEDRGATWRRISNRTTGGAPFEPRWRIGRTGYSPTLFAASDGTLFLNQPEPGQSEPQLLRLRRDLLEWEVVSVAWPETLRGAGRGVVAIDGETPHVLCHGHGAEAYQYRFCGIHDTTPQPLDARLCGVRLASGTDGRAFTYSDVLGLCVREADSAAAGWKPAGSRGLPDTSRFDCRIREVD